MAVSVSGMNPHAAAFNPLSAVEAEDVAEPLPLAFEDCLPPGLSADPIAANMNPYASEFDPCAPAPEQDMPESALTTSEDCLPSELCAWPSSHGAVDVNPYALELWPVAQGGQGSSTISPQLRDVHISSAGFEVTSKTTEDFMACSPNMPMKLSAPAWVKDLHVASGRFDDRGACMVSGSSGQAALEFSRQLAQATAYPAWATQDAWLKWRAMHGAITCSEVSTGQGCTSENSYGRSAADEADFDFHESDAAPAAGETSDDEGSRRSSVL